MRIFFALAFVCAFPNFSQASECRKVANDKVRELYRAIKENDLETVKHLSRKVDLNVSYKDAASSDQCSFAPVITAATYYHNGNPVVRHEIIRNLVKNGARIQKVYNPLTWSQDEAELVLHLRLLLELGYDVLKFNDDSYETTSLLYQTLRSYNFPKVVKLLLDAGADVDATYSCDSRWECQQHDYLTPLAKAASRCLVQERYSKNPTAPASVEMINDLIAAGAKVNDERYPALASAFESGCVDNMEALLKAGARIDMPEVKYGFYKYFANIFEAADKKLISSSEIVRGLSILRSAGLDINQDWTRSGCIKERYTSLTMALTHPYSDVIQYLLETGADPNSKDERGYTALMLAALGFDADVVSPHVEILIKAGARVDEVYQEYVWTALSFMAYNGFPQNFMPLIKAGANVNHQDHRGQTPLYNVTQFCRLGFSRSKGKALEAVKILLANGADPNIDSTTNWYGEKTVLSSAISNRCEAEIVRLIVAAGGK